MPEVDPIRLAIDAARQEQQLRDDLATYRRNVAMLRVERDDPWELDLIDRIADAERRQRDHFAHITHPQPEDR